MIFHENRLLADDSHVISYLIFVENWENVANLSSAAVVIGALKRSFLTVNILLETKTNISLCTDLIFTDHLFIC